MTWHRLVVACVVSVGLLNLAALVFLAGTNRLATNDEARGIASGVLHWGVGDFEMANDAPPLARLAAAAPLMPLGVAYEGPGNRRDDPGDPANVLERELYHAGHFAQINLPGTFNLILMARMTGFLWWLLGAGIILRWTGRLYGRAAGLLGVALWAISPNVLAYEQLATRELPAAVVGIAATHAFCAYLRTPSWVRALLVGLVLGLALLADFVSLTLLVLWPLQALLHARSGGSRRVPASSWIQGFAAVLVSILVLNLGYGFAGSGSRLGDIDFVGRTPERDAGPTDGRPADRSGVHRFRGTWLGGVIVPLPAAYLAGLDRRWHGRVSGAPDDERQGWPVDAGARPYATIRDELPLGIWALMLANLWLLLRRGSRSVAVAEELEPWIPAVGFLAMATLPLGLIPPAEGTLLSTPYAIVIAVKHAVYWRSRRRWARWLAIVSTLVLVAESCVVTHGRFFTPNRTARFRQDLVRQGRKVGLEVPEPRASTGVGAEERGLLYRRFVDSEGVAMNYALFVPEGYRRERPYPLILFLHGWGDRKTTETDRKYVEVGLPFTLKYRGIDFLVLCPQGRSGTWQPDDDDARRAMELLATVQREYRVDPDRIVLTGLSNGGSGAWELAARFPDRWAAIVPVAGSCDPGQAAAIAHIPCWCFHNRYDGVFPAGRPRAMIAAIRASGGRPRYTEFADTNHNAGERTYVLPELYDWLARQRRPRRPDRPGPGWDTHTAR